MKNCRSCNRMLPLSAYYRHTQMADGHLNHCKECVKARVKVHRENNIERIQEYDRQRGLLPHRKAGVKSRAHRYVGKYPPLRETHPEKRKAHIIVGNAIRDGRLKVQPCERCGYGVGVHAHHEDYSKPLDVNWLCARCHGERHREINEERRRAS